MARRTVEALLDRLLDAAGRTYAAEAGIRMADTPAPLYRLLVLTVLASAPISADIAAGATAELVRSGMGTPARMRAASWQERVAALGRGRYRRYDERTATALGDGAELMREQYRDDLRRLRDRADGDPATIRDLLTAFPRVGPTGAAIFCREAQVVWPQLRPTLDARALDGARAIGLPADVEELAGLVRADRVGVLAAALVRVSSDAELAEEVRAA